MQKAPNEAFFNSLQMLKNILFNANCRPSNIHSLHAYCVWSKVDMCFFTQCSQSLANTAQASVPKSSANFFFLEVYCAGCVI